MDACCFLPFRPPSRSHNHPCTPAEGAAHKLEMPETARAGAEEEEVKPPPAPADEEEAKSARGLALARLNRRGLLANLILVVGYAIALWFQVYEYNGEDRQTIAIAVYFVAFVLLILSATLELSIDVCSVRTVGHGRYHAGSVRWNTVISGLFISAGILDIVAFVFWLERRLDVEITILLVSSYVLLVMAVLVFYFQINDIKPQALMLQGILSDTIDLIANLLVLAASVVGVVLRHVQHSQKEEFDDTTDNMELGTVPVWLVSAVLYVVTDAIRVQQE